MDSNNVSKSREDRAQGAFSLRSFAMNDIGLQFVKLASNCAEAALISRSQPPDLRNVKEMKPGISRKLTRSMHRSLRAGNNMNFQLRQDRHALQDGFNCRTEPGLHLGIDSLVLPVIRR
jgi:hypothetical protein